MSVQKRITAAGNATWRVRWRESGRGSRMRSATFATKREARKFDAHVRTVQDLGAHAPVEASRERLVDWLGSWARSHRAIWAPSTCKLRASHLERWIVPYIGDVRLRDLGPERLREWRDDILDHGATPHTMLHVMKTLSSALGDAVKHNKLPSNPLRGIERIPVDTAPRRALSPEESERIRANLPTLQDKVLWGLMSCAGLRIGEAVALRWSDVLDLNSRRPTLTIERAVSAGRMRNRTKTGKNRDVPVICPLADDLRAWRSEQGPDADSALICASRAGTPINTHNWRRRAFDPAARVAKVSWATPKSGRHSFVSWQIAAGEYVVDVARIAGHTVNVCLTHYAREFEHARHGERVDMETAIITARRTVSGSGVPIVCPPSNVVPLRRSA